jgi:alkylation response protein AidB-like acyl-CoA dehydrogenase
VARARENGSYDDPVVRDRLARAKVELEVMRLNALRGLGSSADPGAPSIAKLVWANWHRDLGELAMTVAGADGLVIADDGGIDEHQRLYLFSRADTIYGGSDEIQRTILAERVLGLPRERRPGE